MQPPPMDRCSSVICIKDKTLPHPPRLTDSHCHLDFPAFDGQLDAIITRAWAAGVQRMVTICTRPRLLEQVQAICDQYDRVFYAAGLHPMHVAEEPVVSVDALIAMAQHPRMVGIGETGLDYHYTKDSAAAQKISLHTHIEAAQRTGLPLIIHSRDADADMADILAAEYANAPYTCVMHCFSSGAALAQTALSLGFYLSMSGIATFPKSQATARYFRRRPAGSDRVGNRQPLSGPAAAPWQNQ